MCGNSSSAAAVSTQRQHSYGLCLEGKVAKWLASMVWSIYSQFLCVLEISYSLGFSKNWELGAPEPWLALMKQTPLLWEQFGDRSILLFWALTSRSEETMTVLWWGVNSSTWCCFPLSPGIQHQQQSSCPQEVLTYPLPPSLPTVHSAPNLPPPTPPSLISNFSNPRPFTSDISKRLKRL